MPPTPFSSVDDSEGATISGTDGDAVFKNASNGSTTVNSVTPLSTNSVAALSVLTPQAARLA